MESIVKRVGLFIAIITLLIAFPLWADVKLPAIIGDNMVLQQDTDATIWGWAQPGEKVAVVPTWNDKKTDTVANENGKWNAVIKTPKAGGPYTISIKGNNAIKLKNVLVGEVWICSGQSNMDMPMKGWDKQPIHGGEQDIASSKNPSIRLFIVGKKLSDTPLEDLDGAWMECTPETVKEFSAVGYYFGRKVNAETGFPVGMIHSAWGGTLAQPWMRIEFMKNDDYLKPLLDWYRDQYWLWEQECQKAEKEQKPKPQPQGGARPQDKASSIYNAMIAPMTNMVIKGAIWYQGESNAGNGYLYRDLFPTLIQNWRCDFRNFQMPFYFVQLASYTDHKPGEPVTAYRGQPRNHCWAELREAQLMTNTMKHTGMAVAIDIGQTNNIHPGNKKDVGERLARWALAKDYGKEIDYSGPLYAGYRIEGNKIRVFFDYVGDGLVFKEDKAKGFAVAGQDRQFVWADAEIDGSTVLVSSEDVKNPVSIRYAWDIDPETCLYNTANLPASPFRTDDWKEVVLP